MNLHLSPRTFISIYLFPLRFPLRFHRAFEFSTPHLIWTLLSHTHNWFTIAQLLVLDRFPPLALPTVSLS